jgi:hypothetical protein
MRYMSVLVVGLAMCLQVSYARAEPLKDIPPGEDKIVPVKEGEKAPYGGQLFDNPTALRWANWLQQYKVRLHEDVELSEKRCAADMDAAQARYAITQRVLERQIAQQAVVIQRQDEQLAKPQPWYTTWWFGAIAGSAITAGAVGSIVYFASR